MEKDEFLNLVVNNKLSASIRSENDKIDAIIHMGACSSTTEQDATFLTQNNFEYTKHLAIAAHNAGARFIYASSAATYGDGSNGFEDDDQKIDQLRPLNKQYVTEPVNIHNRGVGRGGLCLMRKWRNVRLWKLRSDPLRWYWLLHGWVES